MLTSDFDFTLPDELIAQHPVKPRDASRLMVVDRRTGEIAHRHFDELPELLDSRDLLVRNNSQVLPARLIGRRAATQGKWEGLFLDERPDGAWEILAKTRGRPVAGETVVVGEGLPLVLESREADGRWIVRPSLQDEADASPLALLHRHGRPPLPPYIRGGIAAPDDDDAYQTVYARRPGSVAAPTAGLHFTADVFDRLAARGVRTADVTLHVGVGTFRPIEAETLDAHVMHTEWAELDAETAAILRDQRARGGRIVAVGTTSARTLETASASGTIQPFQGRTNLFIRPGHGFHAVDVLLTNFHLPRSSLLVLVSSLAGLDLMRRAYAEAVRERYRFFSYGDAMLIIS
ncbi:MAG: tRNA preQ1(34) S-adenosylmethionine ribosyltransferase-isomerase QueA [Paludisphaera borealis]|uniref:tRNA preQ1(34) S-adenosylmethionine ribosyltransferase-isomerase QueA n=1 Tax=Paludisphaera borealis TaxID=1387353 RepID=UPI00284C42E9|nr:tRNA preQ1(34) S-adenosylmethionine ribosyltransferase-isomerase QueA [Paludisphaera borealis]MDR3618293.1 tRNA preQ1(34) S-adenosylmethionine ribosyltransferase-isomerase QueA [Paludisphaera borealis]